MSLYFYEHEQESNREVSRLSHVGGSLVGVWPIDGPLSITDAITITRELNFHDRYPMGEQTGRDTNDYYVNAAQCSAMQSE